MMIPAPARFPLIVFDVLEQQWLGCFDPILDTCARSILDRIALVDERIFRLCLLRTFPLPCIQPNLMNWTFVTVMVVHESPWVLDVTGHTQVESRHALGMPSTWMWGSPMPQVPIAILFNWSGIMGACCDPYSLVGMAVCLADIHSRLPPHRLQEVWLGLTRILTPCTPVARDRLATRVIVRTDP